MLAISADAAAAFGPDAAPFPWLLRELDEGPDGALLTIATVHGGAPRSGIGVSIVACAAMLAGSRGVFICPGDMPQITPGDFIRTGALFNGPNSICRPLLEGLPDHPVLFGNAQYSCLRGLDGGHGAASVLRDCMTSLVTYALANPGVVRDFDTAEHFAPSPTTAPEAFRCGHPARPHGSRDTQVSTSPGES